MSSPRAPMEGARMFQEVVVAPNAIGRHVWIVLLKHIDFQKVLRWFLFVFFLRRLVGQISLRNCAHDSITFLCSPMSSPQLHSANSVALNLFSVYLSRLPGPWRTGTMLQTLLCGIEGAPGEWGTVHSWGGTCLQGKSSGLWAFALALSYTSWSLACIYLFKLDVIHTEMLLGDLLIPLEFNRLVCRSFCST